MKLQMMVKQIFALFTTILLLSIFQNGPLAQYYYKDILSNKQLLAEKTALKERKIRTVEVHSFENDGEPSPGFFCEKRISKNYREIETYTKSPISGKSLLTSYFNDKGFLVKAIDSSDLSVSTSIYEYDPKDNIISITSYSHSND